MLRMKTVYDIFADPAHGWLKVHISELKRLGIADKISSFSYMKGDYAYLEEDCDLSVFIETKQKHDGITIQYREHFTNNESRIRMYADYKY